MTSFLIVSNAFAHALPSDKRLETYKWSGFYGGLNAGLVKHTMNITDNQATTFYATIQQEANPDVTGGLQIGFRHQSESNQPSGVYGLEFSTNFSAAKFKQQYGSPFALYEISTENELKNVLLLQCIGGIAADRTLLFLAAGLSWSNISGNVSNIDGIPFFQSFNVNQHEIGTAVGAGIEYALNEQVSARFKMDLITPKTSTSYNDTDDSFLISNSIAQGTIGINIKFK